MPRPFITIYSTSIETPRDPQERIIADYYADNINIGEIYWKNRPQFLAFLAYHAYERTNLAILAPYWKLHQELQRITQHGGAYDNIEIIYTGDGH